MLSCLFVKHPSERLLTYHTLGMVVPRNKNSTNPRRICIDMLTDHMWQHHHCSASLYRIIVSIVRFVEIHSISKQSTWGVPADIIDIVNHAAPKWTFCIIMCTYEKLWYTLQRLNKLQQEAIISLKTVSETVLLYQASRCCWYIFKIWILLLPYLRDVSSRRTWRPFFC